MSHFGFPPTSVACFGFSETKPILCFHIHRLRTLYSFILFLTDKFNKYLLFKMLLIT